MVNKLISSTIRPTVGEIEKWEAKYEFTLPITYKTFLLEQNGGVPEKKVYTKKGFQIFVDYFLELTTKDHINTIDYGVRTFEDVFNLGYLPIARESTGGLVVLSAKGHLFYWNHEDPPKKKYFKKVGSSIKKFIASLTEETATTYGQYIDLIDDGTKADIIQFLQTDYDINQPLEIGKTILERAALLKKNWLLAEMIGRGADTKGGLEQTITLDNYEGFELLLNANADPNEITSMDYPILHQLVIGENKKYIQKLLSYHPNLDWKDRYGRTALDVALQKKANGYEMDGIIQLLEVVK